jgi:hypothetical protein
MTIRASILPALAAVALLAVAPASAAEKCADQIAATKAAADSQPDAARKAKALNILKDAESDLQEGKDEAFCLDEVAAARKALGLK